MSSPKNILAVVAALVVSARTAPPDIGRGSFSYDLNSVNQNERILRLFLHLASETADSLIRLKNDAEQRQREESAIRSGADVPKFRIELPDDIPEERIVGSGQRGHSGRPRYREELDDHPVRYGRLSLDRYATGDRLNDRVFGPYVPATENSLISGHHYRTHRRSNVTGSRQNPRSINDSQESAEVQNRMMFNGEKNTYVNQDDDSRNMTNEGNSLGDQNSTAGAVSSSERMSEDSNHEIGSDGTTSAIGSSLEGQSSTVEAVILTRTMSEDSNHDIESDGTTCDVGSSSDDQSSTVGAVTLSQAMSEDSNLETGSVGRTSAVGSSSGDQSSTSIAVVSSQIMDEDLNHETRSDGATSAVGSSLGDQSSTAKAVNSSETVSEDSNHKTGSVGTTSEVVSLSGDHSSTARVTTSRQAMIAAPSLQSAPAGLISSVQSVGSNNHSARGGRIADEAMAAGSVMKSSSSSQLAAESKRPQEAAAAGSRNETSQMISSLTGDQRHEAIANDLGVLDSSEFEGILSNADPATTMTNQGFSVGNTSKSISVMANVARGISDTGAQIANGGSWETSPGMPNPAMMSVAPGQKEKGGQALKGFTGAGTKYTGSMIIDRGTGTGKTPTVMIHQRRNSAFAPLRNDSGGATQGGSSVMGTSPLFRSFLDHGARSDSVESFATDSQKGSNEVPNKAAKDSLTGYENGIIDRTFEDQRAKEYGDGGVSKVELNKYADHFADALRPVRTKT